MSTALESQPKSERFLSVDVLRGLTILLMVFVNDLGRAAPSWMHHIQPSDADGMTLADVVFPFFLFIAGVSIPLAVRAAKLRNGTTPALLLHVLTRTLGLLVMGLIGVNCSAEIRMGPELWGLLAYLSVICAWCVVPRDPGKRRTTLLTMKMVGVAGLVTLLAVYRREPTETTILFRGPVTDWTWMTTSWWGILGLIGWAYLVTAFVYLLLGARREWLMAAMGLLMLNFLVADHGGFFTRIDDKSWLELIRPVLVGLQQVLDNIDSYVNFSSQLGSLPAIMMAGCILGTVVLPESGITTPPRRVQWTLVYAAGLFVAGAMTDTFAGVNKISATPTWCFWCASLASLTWLILYGLIDVAHVSRWTVVVRPAGANPLIAYLLHPIILFVLSLSGLGATVRSYADSTSGVAIAGSLAMAIVVCGLTGLIARAGFRIRV